MNARSHSTTRVVALIASLCGAASAAVPEYRVEVIEPLTVTTFVRGASDAGFVVGDRVVLGVLEAFVATPDDGVATLPLPPGYVSSAAYDVNDHGVVVGTVSQSSLATDFGEPAVWTPDGAGGYTVEIPQQFTTVQSPLGPLGVNGGQITAVNNAGQLVGFTRYQGFGGGPATMFSLSGPPTNLADLGFSGTAEDINELGVVCGRGQIFDLATNTATELGVPDPLQPGNVSFTNVLAYAINDENEVVVAADLASVVTENYLTYTWTDSTGFDRLNPAQLPSRFVGFYDNNDRGDVSASGGIYFADEDALFTGFDAMLAPEDAGWNVSLGFIADDRKIYTTATDPASGDLALVVLVPTACPADLAVPQGVLDLADVDAFIAAFSSNDPLADLATPFGLLDLADVDAFIAAFLAGCP